MRAGQLRHKVAVQVRTEVTDNMGGYTETWATVTGMSAVPALVAPLRSNERLESMKLENDVTHRIMMRYRSGINLKNRIYWDSRSFNIISIINRDERNISLEMLAQEITT